MSKVRLIENPEKKSSSENDTKEALKKIEEAHQKFLNFVEAKRNQEPKKKSALTEEEIKAKLENIKKQHQIHLFSAIAAQRSAMRKHTLKLTDKQAAELKEKINSDSKEHEDNPPLLVILTKLYCKQTNDYHNPHIKFMIDHAKDTPEDEEIRNEIAWKILTRDKKITDNNKIREHNNILKMLIASAYNGTLSIIEQLSHSTYSELASACKQPAMIDMLEQAKTTLKEIVKTKPMQNAIRSSYSV